MGNKVRCKFCKFEQQKKCMKKKGVHTKVSKKRMCSIYKADEEKIKDWLSRRENLPSEVMPKWAWNKKDRRAERDRLVQEEMMKNIGTTAEPADPKHPSTGDLSKFIGSTAEENKDE
jgi:hypothetical protein